VAAFRISGDSNPCVSKNRELYNFLSDFNNFKSILPEDKVEDFVAEGDACSFTIKGITAMRIRIADQTPFSMIYFSSEGLSKFNFKLRVNFNGEADQLGECTVAMEGDLNPFILKMAEKSLQAFVNSMSLKLSQLNV